MGQSRTGLWDEPQWNAENKARGRPLRVQKQLTWRGRAWVRLGKLTANPSRAFWKGRGTAF